MHFRAQLVVMVEEPTNSVTYGATFADVYDEWYGESDDLPAIVSLLSEDRPRRVLELGVGTGRIAIPLARHLREMSSGAETLVMGIDESPEMLALLARRDTAGLVRTVLGDMALGDSASGGTSLEQPAELFDLVVVSYNTLFNLGTADRQAMCITNAASRLAEQGRLILDCCIIDPDAPSEGESTEQRGGCTLHTHSTFDRATGRITGTTTSHHDDGRVVARPFSITYNSPQSLDEMCESAGLRLRARYASWQKTAFTDDSARHVSVYHNVR